MLHLHDHTPRDSPLLRERFAHPQDRRVGDFVRGETANQIGYGVQRNISADQRIYFATVIPALLDRIVTRIIGALGPLDRRTDLGPERVGQAHDHDRAVERREDAVRHEVGML